MESQDDKNSRATAIKEEVIKLQHIYDTKEIIQSIKVYGFLFFPKIYLALFSVDCNISKTLKIDNQYTFYVGLCVSACCNLL